MNHFLSAAAITGLTLCLHAVVQADEIQFTTLPQTVQTTVIRETRISDGSGVTRIVRDSGGVYAVTVHGNSGPRTVYVDDSGTVVQAPAATTTTTTVRAPASTTTVMPAPATTTTVEKSVQTTEPAMESTMVTYDQVQGNGPRYQLLEKKGKKEIYLDRQTNQKVTVKRN